MRFMLTEKNMHTAENIGKERRKPRNSFAARRRRDCRRGSYIVEAASPLPVRLIAMRELSSIVLYYSCIEDTAFITATEFRKGSIEAAVSEGQPLIPLEVAERTRDNHPILDSHRILDYGFRKNRNGLNELIYLNLEMDMKTRNPLGILSQSRHDSALMTRAYVGQVRNCKAMTEAEFRNELADGVFIFPQDGEKYHNKNQQLPPFGNQSLGTDGIGQKKIHGVPSLPEQGGGVRDPGVRISGIRFSVSPVRMPGAGTAVH